MLIPHHPGTVTRRSPAHAALYIGLLSALLHKLQMTFSALPDVDGFGPAPSASATFTEPLGPPDALLCISTLTLTHGGCGREDKPAGADARRSSAWLVAWHDYRSFYAWQLSVAYDQQGAVR
jgi:hypothetical protein